MRRMRRPEQSSLAFATFIAMTDQGARVRLASLLDTALPMNRKERFFTGTIIPMILCSDDFRYFGRFLRMAGIEDRLIHTGDETTNVQFFTEYGFAESRFPPAVRARFPEFVLGRDTPDVLVYIAGEKPLLLGVEAKMYDVPDRPSLQEQIDRQEQLLLYIAQYIGNPEIAQVALLPEKLADRMTLSCPIVTWEALIDEYEAVSPAYFVSMLKEALRRYDDLVSRPPDRLLGQEIVARFKAGDHEYNCMGRQGGLEGDPLKQDVDSSRWMVKAYSCRQDPIPPNQNWFPIADFVKLVESRQERIPSPYSFRVSEPPHDVMSGRRR